MVTQGVLEFQYETDTSKTGLMANAGLSLQGLQRVNADLVGYA